MSNLYAGYSYSEPARKARVAPVCGDNPFVPISNAARVGFVIYFVFWRILPELAVALQFDTQAGNIVVARMSVRVLTDILLLLPILLNRFAGTPIGWLHPLVLPTLLVIAKGIVTNPLKLMTAVTAWLTPSTIPDYALLGGLSLKDCLSVELMRDSLLLLAQFCYLLGFSLITSRAHGSVAQGPVRIVQWRFFVVTSFCFGAFLLFIEMNGGLATHFSSLAYGRFPILENAGHFLVIIGLLPYLLVLWYAARPRILRQPWFIALFVAALFAQFTTTGSRSSLIVPAVLIQATWMLINRRPPALQIAFLGLFVTLFIGLLGDLRISSIHNSGVVDFSVLTDFNLQTATDRTMQARQKNDEVSGEIAIMNAVPESVPHLYGTSYVSALAFFVPRTIWPNKPRGPGAHVGAIIYSGMDSTVGYTGTSFPTGKTGEAYWNFGVLGVAFVYLLFGLFFRIVTHSFLRRPGDPFRAIVLLTSITMLWDASSDSIVGFVQVLTLLYVSWFFVRRSGAMPAERLQ